MGGVSRARVAVALLLIVAGAAAVAFASRAAGALNGRFRCSHRGTVDGL